MGILSSIFGKADNQNKSYVQNWYKRYLDEKKVTDNKPTLKTFFVFMMSCVIYFLQKPSKKSSDLSPLFDINNYPYLLNTNKSASSDVILFEIGCYMVFRIDTWLFKYKTEFREEIIKVFMSEFVKLFSEAFPSVNIPEVFNKRMSGFAYLARTKTDMEGYLFHISQLIVYSKDSQLPKDYDFENPSALIILDINEDMMIKSAVMNWEKIAVRLMKKILEDRYFSTVTSKI